MCTFAQAIDEHEQNDRAYENVQAIFLPGKPDDTEHNARDRRRDQEKQTELNDALWVEVSEPGKNSGEGAQLRPRCAEVRVVGNRQPGAAEIHCAASKNDDCSQGDPEAKHRGNGDVYVLIGGMAHLDLSRDAAVHHLDAENDDDKGKYVSEGFDSGFDENMRSEE